MEFKGLSPLFLTSTIRSFALSLLGIFTPLYIFKLFETQPALASFGRILIGVLAYYAVFHLFVLIFNYPAAFFIRQLHFRGMMMLGNFFNAGHLLFLILAGSNLWFLALSAVFGGLAVPCYWHPSHAIFINNGRQKRLGRDLSTQGVLGQLAGIAGPALGGIIITHFGFTSVYILALSLVCISSLPIFLMPHHPKFYLLSFFKLAKRFCSRRFRKDFISLAATGVEGRIQGIFWPIFVFAIIGSYEVMGILKSSVAAISLLILFLVGNLVDKKSKASVLIFGGVTGSLIWLARILVKTVPQVFLIDSADTILAKFWGIPFDALVYKKAEDETLINYLIFREWAIHIGQLGVLILMMVLIALGANFLISFVLAACATLLSLLIAI